MSRTIRGKGRFDAKDGDLQSITKDKNPKKSFLFHGEQWATKAAGGPGNKRGWKRWIPKWLYNRYKQKQL